MAIDAQDRISTLGDALRLLGLPLDAPIDESMLVVAYRDAARAHHPDAAPEHAREEQTERMREINVARDLVRSHLSRLVEHPYQAFAPSDEPPAGLFWDVGVDDLAGLGVRWNPHARRVPWSARVRAARLALGVVVGDEVTVETDGVLRLGRVTAFDETTRVGLRTSLHGIPVEVRRVGMDVLFEDERLETVDAADVRAAGWRCPVCHRTSSHGVPRTRPCPRCLRRFRSSYERFRDTAAARRRLRRRIARLTSEGSAFAPRRYPRYRAAEQALADARERSASLEATRASLTAALDEAAEAEAVAEARLARTRSERGARLRQTERERHAAEVRRARAALAAVEAALADARERVVALDAERSTLERELRARHQAAERVRRDGADRRERERREAEAELRRVELELAAIHPDAPALLDAFDAWGERPDDWLR